MVSSSLQTKLLLIALLPTCCRHTDAFLTHPSVVRTNLQGLRWSKTPTRHRRSTCLNVQPNGESESLSPLRIDSYQKTEVDLIDDQSIWIGSPSIDDENSVKIMRLKVQIQEAVGTEDYVTAASLQRELTALQRQITKLQFGSLKGDLAVRQPTASILKRKPATVRTVIPAEDRARSDESDDELFYAKARMAIHTDLPFALHLQELYSKRLGDASTILDLGASCASFLPDNGIYQRVVGLGMNMEEMLANEDLTERVVHNLNACSALPFRDEEFDAVLCASTLHYLTQTEAVLAEIRRVLRPGGVLLVSFSDRYFESKTIEGWKRRGSISRCDMLAECLAAAGGMTPPERVLRMNPLLHPLSQLAPPLRGLCGGDPFLAIVSYKGAPPPGWAVRLHAPTPLKIPLINLTVAPLQLTPFAAVYLIYTLFHFL